MMATWLADVLRGAGLIVEEVAGWQDRGHGELANDASNMVDVLHHTAGGPVGRAPSLATCIYGVPAVAGPLCNVMQTREPVGPDHFIVIAAGNSYNAGVGGWAGVSGNRYTIGLEVEHTGVEWFPDPDRAQYTRRFSAAVLSALGHTDASRQCQHFEWSTAGKIDIAQGVDPDLWRAQTTEIMHGGGGGTPVPSRPKLREDDVELAVVRTNGGPDYFWVDENDQLLLRHTDADGQVHEPTVITVHANHEHPNITIEDLDIPGSGPATFLYILGKPNEFGVLRQIRVANKGLQGWVGEFV